MVMLKILSVPLDTVFTSLIKCINVKKILIDTNYKVKLKALLKRIKIVFNHLRNGRVKPIIENLSTRLYSTKRFIGVTIKKEQLKNTDYNLNLSIRPFEQKDIGALKEGQRHRRLVEEKIPNCYVATIDDDTVVFRQWLFQQNVYADIITYFGPIFPKINKEEAIIEGVFTHVDFRGLRIMPNAIYKVLNQDHYNSIKKVIAFIEETNIGSLKGFYRLGFKPYIIRQEKWFLFKRTVCFVPLYFCS